MATLRLSCLLLLLVAISGCGDNKPPRFLDVTVLTNTDSTIGPYEVLVTVDDDSLVETVELRYRLNNDEEVNTSGMDRLGGNVFSGLIAGQPLGTTIKYQIVARDKDGAEAASPADVTTTHVLEVKARE